MFNIMRDAPFADNEGEFTRLMAMCKHAFGAKLATWHCISLVTKQGLEVQWTLVGLKSSMVYEDLNETFNDHLFRIFGNPPGFEIGAVIVNDFIHWNRLLASIEEFIANNSIKGYVVVRSNLADYKPDTIQQLPRERLHYYKLLYKEPPIGNVLHAFLQSPFIKDFSMMLSNRDKIVFANIITTEPISSFIVNGFSPSKMDALDTYQHYVNASNKHRDHGIPILKGPAPTTPILINSFEPSKICAFYTSSERTLTKTIYATRGENNLICLAVVDP